MPDLSLPHVGRDWSAFLSRMVGEGVHEVTISGVNSDPLLCLDTPKIIESAHSLGLRVGLHTNGIGNPDIALAADKTTLSLHSFNPYIFEAITSCHSSQMTSVLAFARLVLAKRPLKLSATYVSDNADEISGGDWFMGAAELGVKRAVIRKCVGGSLDPRLPDDAQTLKSFAGQHVADVNGIEVTIWDYSVANRNLAPISLWPDNTIRNADAWDAISPKWHE